MQAQAEAAVAAILPDPNGPAASLVSIEPTTGYVRAMVGGRDFFGTGAHAKLNLATQGPAPGGLVVQAVRPRHRARAGHRPAHDAHLGARPASPSRSPDAGRGSPCNYGGGGGGTVTIAEGTVRSYNTLYAQLIMRVGPKEAMEGATRSAS